MYYDYAFVIKNIEHYKALGQDSVHLWVDDYKALPWDKVTGLKSGGSHRLNIPTSVRFYTQHSGVEITWFLELENRDANGRGMYGFDMEKIEWVMNNLSENGKKKFSDWLKDIVYAEMKKQTMSIFNSYLSSQKDENTIWDMVEKYGR